MKDIDLNRSKVGDEARESEWRERLRAGDPVSEMTPLAEEEVRTMRRAMLGALPEERRSPWRLPLLAATAFAALLALVAGLKLWPFGAGPARTGRAIPQIASAPPAEPEEAGSRSAARTPEPPVQPGALSPKEGSSQSGAPSAPLTGTPGSPGALSTPAAGARAAQPAGRAASPSLAGARRSPPIAPRARGVSPPRLASTSPDHGARSASRLASANPAPAPLATPAQARRELQFSTPGGTRIVWVFASDEAPDSAPPRPTRL